MRTKTKEFPESEGSSFDLIYAGSTIDCGQRPSPERQSVAMGPAEDSPYFFFGGFSSWTSKDSPRCLTFFLYANVGNLEFSNGTFGVLSHSKWLDEIWYFHSWLANELRMSFWSIQFWGWDIFSRSTQWFMMIHGHHTYQCMWNDA